MSCESVDGPCRSRRRVLLGVCGGLADHFNFSRFWTRIVVLTAFVFTGFWPVGAVYLVLALLMRREPRVDRRWVWRVRYEAPTDGLDARLHRMESRVRAQQYEWDARLRQG